MYDFIDMQLCIIDILELHVHVSYMYPYYIIANTMLT